MKPTNFCRMVKIKLQFAITLILDDVNVEIVSWCGSIYTCFQNFCRNDREILQEFGFVAELSR